MILFMKLHSIQQQSSPHSTKHSKGKAFNFQFCCFCFLFACFTCPNRLLYFVWFLFLQGKVYLKLVPPSSIIISFCGKALLPVFRYHQCVLVVTAFLSLGRVQLHRARSFHLRSP